MKENILPAVRFTIVSFLIFGIIYSGVILRIASFSPNQGKGELVSQNKKHFYKNIGQNFNSQKYFWSRPSAVGYNAAGSAGSNKGPSNSDYLQIVKARIDTFMVYHPYVKTSEIPSEMVTASGSGLDPHISVQAAIIQIPRIAKSRNIPENIVSDLVEEATEKPLYGFLGPEKINVLSLNLLLDKQTKP